MNYFIAVVMFVGLLMMLNIERFNTQPTGSTLNGKKIETPIKTQENSPEPQETLLLTPPQNNVDVQTTADIYKCKNSNGKIVYSEAQCPSNTVGSRIAIVQNVIDSTDLRRQMANSKNQASVTTVAAEAEDFMSPYKRDTRIRELNISIKDEMATYEKREDARRELAYLENSSPKDLSYELEQQRRNWKVQLTDFDRQKRGNALSALASIYTNYR